MARRARVAFFTDSFHEVNGVALTSRQFHSYASRHDLPFLSVHAGPQTVQSVDGSVLTYELNRGPLSFGLESDLSFDVGLWRFYNDVEQAVRQFAPDVVHITGPGDFGQLGALIAHRCHLPLAASWHTNVHEYAGRRLEKLLHFLDEETRHKLGAVAEDQTLFGAALFYRLANMLFAPNEELVDLLFKKTHKPCFLMQRGVDTALFDPAKRPSAEAPFTVGYVGRLSPEKRVRFLADIERALLLAGHDRYRLLIVGDGGERSWLEQNLRQADFAGVLHGEQLAQAYARMDIFVFPSETDTYGNVIQEAQASGVPSIVTSHGGPKFLVQHGVSGYVAVDDHAFLKHVLHLYENREELAGMKAAARVQAMSLSWDRVFDSVYDAYASTLAIGAI